MHQVRFAVAVLWIGMGSGCGLDEGVGTLDRESVVDNGKNLNGKNLNGKNLNGTTLGTVVLWTSFEGVKLNGAIMLDDAWLDGTELVGQVGSSIKRGLEFHQAEFQAVSETGQALRLRAAHMEAPAAPEDPWRYSVEYLDTDSEWYPICLDGAVAQPAIAIDGWWNPAEGEPGGGGKVNDASKFTFACPVVGAIGKCIEIGYQPWAEEGGVSLDAHHRGCVRALRADYCGDGVPHTTDGAVINIYDGLGIQLDTEDWRIEAEWDADGARCFSTNNRSLDHLSCFRSRATSACGKLSHFDTGTLLMSEKP